MAPQVVLPASNLFYPNRIKSFGNFFMHSDTVVMSLQTRAALFLGGEDIREDKERADSFRKSGRLGDCLGMWGMVTPEHCLNVLGYCSNQFDIQYVVSLGLPKQEKLEENMWRQRTFWRTFRAAKASAVKGRLWQRELQKHRHIF